MRRHPLHREFFLWLLPLFFVLHGFVENYPAVPIGGALLLLLKYLVGIAVVTAVVYFLYRRNFRKASLFVFIAAFFYFFFGPFQDLLNKFLPGTLFTRYVFLLPLIVSFYVIAFVFFQKKPVCLEQAGAICQHGFAFADRCGRADADRESFK